MMLGYFREGGDGSGYLFGTNSVVSQPFIFVMIVRFS